jgi:uncharacterized protein (TIGR02453 family)
MMKPRPLDELEFYPPFEGFPKEGIAFLKKLKRNNNRDWFGRHKHEYESLVKQPMQSLIIALQPHFRRFAPDIDADPKRSLFRIHRDVRFSKDKSPYKTHVAAHFVRRGKEKGTEGSGYYLHIEPGEVFLGAGIYMPDGEQLKKIRRAIADRPEEFLSIINAKSFRRTFGKLEGEKLQRVPRGYPTDHPMAKWLRYKQFFVWLEWPEEKSFSVSFVNAVAKVFEEAAPLEGFLNDTIGR